MRVVITGSRRGHPDLERWLTRWVERFGAPVIAVVGDNEDTPGSVDKRAYEWFSARPGRCHYLARVCVDRRLPSPQRFHVRDRQMVEIAKPGDWLLAFPDSQSRGTYLTFGLAQKRGLVCKMARVVEARS